MHKRPNRLHAPSVRSHEAGLTLIEMMVVLVLIGLLAGTLGVMVYRRYVDGQIKVARVQVGDVRGRVQQFMISRNRCPTVEDLVNERFVGKPPQDPWGNPLIIRCPGENDREGVDVVSIGPDRTDGTADDVTSWAL